MTQRVQGVLLDVDGTLVNSNDAHARAWVDALAEVQIQVGFAEVRRAIGMGADKLLPAVANIEEASALGRRVSQRRAELFKEQHLPRLRAFPQTRALLLRMRESGLSLAVATSAQKSELEPLLGIANVLDLIEDKASSSDAQGSKPDPDIVQAALAKLGFEPERVVMLGDTPYDIEAAARAGARSIALRCGGRSDADLAGALAIYDDPADLLAHFESSPLSRRAA
jgi:HAD superfamily hydrolase (TIGR01509 family)